MSIAAGLALWALLFYLPFCKPMRDLRKQARVSRNQGPKNMEPVEQLWMEDDLGG